MNSGLRVHFPRLLLYRATCGSGSKLLLLHNISTVGSQMTSHAMITPGQVNLKWLKNSNMLLWDVLGCLFVHSNSPNPLLPPTFHTHTHTHTLCPLSVKTGGLPACLFRPNTYTHPSNQYFSLSLYSSIFHPSFLSSISLLPISVLILVIRTIFTSSSQTEFQRLPVSLFLSLSVSIPPIFCSLLRRLWPLNSFSHSSEGLVRVNRPTGLETDK